MELACCECGVKDDKAYLYKCPICHKMVCEEHRTLKSGRVFCSAPCAAGFFYDDEQDAD